jgi:peroxin-4
MQMLENPGIDSPLNVDVAALLRNGDAIGAESLVRWFISEEGGRWSGH